MENHVSIDQFVVLPADKGQEVIVQWGDLRLVMSAECAHALAHQLLRAAQVAQDA